ncbi:MBL fold metallo-hydrolase [Methylophilaceae bacterium]|nr:MBL fold metallo-hydrolase [Methylophilaceae bacterium]
MDDVIQQFDPVSFTYTYILIDHETNETVIIDPVDTKLNQLINFITDKNLKVRYVMETHAHADHITSAGNLCKVTGATAATPTHCNITSAEIQLNDGDELNFGKQQKIIALHTPGHTAGSMSFIWNDNVFTGDTLLINGCGRTDFQSGSSQQLYKSITEKLFTLPDNTKVFPGHDYHGNKRSTIGDEKKSNPRLAGKSLEDFINIMDNLNLPKPKLIDEAVPANLTLGLVSHAAE